MALNEQVSHLDWWTEQLKDNTVSPLTRDYPEPTSENITRRPIEAVEILESSEKVKLALRNLERHGLPHEVLLTALVVLVSRLTGDEDISVGANVQPNASPFVLRVPVSFNDSFSVLLKRVVDALSAGEAHATPLAAVRAHLKTNVLFRFAAFNSTGETAVDSVYTTDFLLQYHIAAGGRIELRARYNQRLFSSTRIAGILAQLFQFIENAAVDAAQIVGSIDFCTPEQRGLLPDPSSDLGWSSFRGAIHDIFAANAEAHPDRLCVVETKSGTSPERHFSYKQINQASNVL